MKRAIPLLALLMGACGNDTSPPSDAGVVDTSTDAGPFPCAPGPMGGIGVPEGTVFGGDLVVAHLTADHDLVARMPLRAAIGYRFPHPVRIVGVRIAGTAGRYSLSDVDHPISYGSATYTSAPRTATEPLEILAPPIPVNAMAYTNIVLNGSTDDPSVHPDIAEISFVTAECP